MNKSSIKRVKIGNIAIGGSEPVRVQTMTTIPTKNIHGVREQILQCQKAGAEIIRVSILDKEDALSIKELKKDISIPIVADIHYNYKLAILSLENGADKLRINPGNLGGEDKLKMVCETALKYGKPIRVGVNAGSLEKELKSSSHHEARPEDLVQSAYNNVKLLEDMGFYDIVVSIKANDIERTIESNRLFRKEFLYPLHIGVTEAGTERIGTIKHSIALYELLPKGIGETIRISLSSDPVSEIMTAWDILKVIGIRSRGLDIISCPTCGRKNLDILNLAKEVERHFYDIAKTMKVAIMGCPVNGIDESKIADIGICGISPGKGALWYRGEKLFTISEKNILEYLEKYIDKYLNEL